MPRRTTPPRLDIRLLGPPEILVDGRPLAVDTRKAVAIVAVLAAEGRPYAREELAALLWPDADDVAARGALRRTLSTLRSAVEAAPGTLQVERERVRLGVDGVRVDLVELERLARSDRPADLAAAAALARGPFLAGFSLRDSPEFDDWTATRASTVEHTVVAVLDRLVTALAEDGDLAGAAAVAGRRVDLDPLDEGAHVRRMDLLAASGERSAAVRQYRTCVAVLERELGVAPLSETTARYEAIRDAPLATPDAPPPAPSPTPIPAPEPAAASGSSLVRRLPLIGRDAELERFDAAWRAAGPDGRVIAIVGEPGIGKTHFAHVGAERARAHGAATLFASAYAVERGIAYGPIVGLLQAALADPAAAKRIRALDPAVVASLGSLVNGLTSPGAPPAGTGAVAQARLMGAIADAITAAVAGPVPGLVMVDDLHWADAATLGVLAHLVRRLADRPMAVVLTWRTEELDEVARPVAALARARAGAATIELGRLDRAAVAAMAQVAPAVVSDAMGSELWRASEGLPLYVAEALATGPTEGAGMPAGVRAVLDERLASVDGLAAQVLAAAAAIGRSFDLATLRYASGRTDDEVVEAVESLNRRGLIRPSDDYAGSEVRFDFAHGAVRDLVDGSTSLARRRLLHRRIADGLRLDAPLNGRDDPGRLARIARHEREAGRDSEAAEAFRSAGDAASRVFANREAIDLYDAALGLDHPEPAMLHLGIGDLRTRIGDYGRAIDAYESAAALVDPAGLPAVEAALAHAHLRRGDLVAADRHLDAALVGSTDPGWQARRLVDRATIRRRAGDRVGAAAAAAAAAIAAEQTADPVALGAARRIAGLVALDAGDAAAAVAHLGVALDAAADDPDPTATIAVLTGLAMATAATGDPAGAVRYGETAVSVCRRIGDRHLEAAVENHMADLLHEAGLDDEALEHLRRAVAAFAEVDGDPADPDPGVWRLSAW